MKEHKKIIVDISRNNKGEISCGLQLDAVLAKNELYAGIQSIAMGSMMSGLIPPEIDDCINKEDKFVWNFMALTLTISWLAGTAMVLAIVAMIVKWAIQYIF